MPAWRRPSPPGRDDIARMDNGTLIIGAGPAGLACAMELCRAGQTATVIEKDESIGGLAKTLTIQDGDATFLTDIGPHRFFSKNKYLYDFIEDLLAEEWRAVPRYTRQFIDGKFFNYPVNAMQVVKNIGMLKSMRMGFDYFWAVMKYKVFRAKISTFEDYVVAHFGRALAEFSMINYTEKIWGIPAATIHPDWARQRIKGLNLLSVLKNALFLGKGKNPKSLVDEFYYPQFGTGRIYEAIVERLRAKGNAIHTNSHPTKVRHDGKRITEVELSMNGETRVVKPKTLVESVPLTSFLELLDPAPPAEVMEASKALRWRSQIYLFLTLDKPRITKDNWIYFPNKEIPFGRVSEMKNFSDEMSPKDKTSLFIEFFVFETDAIWTKSKEEIFEEVLPYFETWGFFTRDEVRSTYLIKRSHVYPVYDMTYESNVNTIKAYLDKLENLVYIGRPGRFRYTNQDHSLEMGILASKTVMDGTRFDLDEIGAEHEYFESGRIHDKRI